MVIGGDGSVSVNGKPVGQIAMADPAGTKDDALGASLYRGANGEELAARPPTARCIRAFSKAATGSEMGTMVSMLSMMRNYDVVDESRPRHRHQSKSSHPGLHTQA